MKAERRSGFRVRGIQPQFWRTCAKAFRSESPTFWERHGLTKFPHTNQGSLNAHAKRKPVAFTHALARRIFAVPSTVIVSHANGDDAIDSSMKRRLFVPRLQAAKEALALCSAADTAARASEVCAALLLSPVVGSKPVDWKLVASTKKSLKRIRHWHHRRATLHRVSWCFSVKGCFGVSVVCCLGAPFQAEVPTTWFPLGFRAPSRGAAPGGAHHGRGQGAARHGPAGGAGAVAQSKAPGSGWPGLLSQRFFIALGSLGLAGFGRCGLAGSVGWVWLWAIPLAHFNWLG